MRSVFSTASRCRRPELMDQPGLDDREHALALRGLGRINAVSRTAAALWPSLAKLAREQAPAAGPLRVLDLATGGGDTAVTLANRADRAGLAIEIEGCDLSARGRGHRPRPGGGPGIAGAVLRARRPRRPDPRGVRCSHLLAVPAPSGRGRGRPPPRADGRGGEAAGARGRPARGRGVLAGLARLPACCRVRGWSGTTARPRRRPRSRRPRRSTWRTAPAWKGRRFAATGRSASSSPGAGRDAPGGRLGLGRGAGVGRGRHRRRAGGGGCRAAARLARRPGAARRQEAVPASQGLRRVPQRRGASGA